MGWVALVTIILLFEYFVFVALVGVARVKSGVYAPVMVGDPLFERALRVQQNTAEQLIIVLPSLWIFAFYVSATWAAILGAIFFIARALYCIGYRKKAAKRRVGFGLVFLVLLVLLAGSFYGVLITLF